MVFQDYYAMMTLGRTRTAEQNTSIQLYSQGCCLHVSPWIDVSPKRLFTVGKLL